MRVLELSLRNYRVFEEVDLELPPRVIGIFGPNGSGKTSLVESMAFGLYGVDAARTKKNEIRTQGLLTDCEVRMVFEHGGQQYEVRRSIKGKGHTPEAELYVGGLLLASGTNEVDAEVRRLLHMDLRVFRASVFAEQKQLDAFSEVTAGKRKEMALRLLGIRPVEDALTAARRETKAARQAATQLEGAVADIAALEADLKEARDQGAEAGKAATALAREVRATSARFKEARKAFEAADHVRQRVETLTAELSARTEQRERLVVEHEERADRVARLERGVAAIPDLEAALASLDGLDERLRVAERWSEVARRVGSAQAQLAALAEIDEVAAGVELEAAEEAFRAAEAALAEATARRDHARRVLAEAEQRLARASDADPSQPCPTCGRPLGDDFAGYVRHCRQEVQSAKGLTRDGERAVRAAGSTRTDAADHLKSAQATAGTVRSAAAERAALVGQAESLRAEAEALAEPFEGTRPDLEALRDGVRRAAELAKRLAELRSERRRLDQETVDLARTEEALAEVQEKLDVLAAEAEGLSFDGKEFGRLRAECDDAEGSLEAAQAAERDAQTALRDAEKAVSGLEGRLVEARETERRVGDLRSEARYLERTGMLLDGFRDHLVTRVGPELSRESEALFRDLTNREYDDLRIDDQTLSIEIADGESYHPIERFSGSETDLANLALRVAISTHLSRVSGADLGMMVLDEVLGSLDVERKDLFVQAMGRLANRFHQLFVITHAEQVKDQFPAAIEVRKVARRRSQAALV